MKKYSVRIWVLGLVLGGLTRLADSLSVKLTVVADVYWGLLFLVALFWALRYYVDRSQVSNPNQWIRRAMVSSMIRLMGVLTFLLISVSNCAPALAKGAENEMRDCVFDE